MKNKRMKFFVALPVMVIGGAVNSVYPNFFNGFVTGIVIHMLFQMVDRQEGAK